MHIATCQFPRVWVSSTLPSNWESELEALLCQGERFVLLTRDMPDKKRDANEVDKKQFALWLKRNRERLAQVCAGSIVVVQSQVIALSLSAVVGPLGKAFGFPIRVVSEEQIDAAVNKLFTQV